MRKLRRDFEIAPTKASNGGRSPAREVPTCYHAGSIALERIVSLF